MKDESCRYDLPAVPLPTIRPEYDKDRNITNKPDPAVTLMWSADFLPAIGDRVLITMNGLGPGRVASYFTEHGWLGVSVRLEKDPDWHVKQCRGTKWAGHALVFGAEIKPLSPTTQEV